MIEEWKPIRGYTGLYEVSNHGRIRSKARVVKRCNGRKQTVKGKVLKQSIDRTGYNFVVIRANGIQKTKRIHRLMALSFFDKVNKNLTVNHKNGIKTDNRIINLELMTLKENIQHAWKNGLYRNNSYKCKGEDHGMNKLSEDQVKNIIRILKDNTHTQKEIAQKFNISKSHVSSINNRVVWKYLWKETNDNT